MYCRHCGNEVETGHKHCRKCGAKQLVDTDVNGNILSGDSELAVITKAFIAICLFLMFIAGLKMLADDNYAGLVFVVAGFGALIYGLFWWQSRRVTQFQKSERGEEKELGRADENLLHSVKEQFSVTEEATRKFESAQLRRNR